MTSWHTSYHSTTAKGKRTSLSCGFCRIGFSSRDRDGALGSALLCGVTFVGVVVAILYCCQVCPLAVCQVQSSHLARSWPGGLALTSRSAPRAQSPLPPGLFAVGTLEAEISLHGAFRVHCGFVVDVPTPAARWVRFTPPLAPSFYPTIPTLYLPVSPSLSLSLCLSSGGPGLG